MPQPRRLKEYMLQRARGLRYKQIGNYDTIRKNMFNWRKRYGAGNDVQLLAILIVKGEVTVEELREVLKHD